MTIPSPLKVKANGHAKSKFANIVVRINADELTFGDIRFMNRIEKMGDDLNGDDFEKMTAFLDRIVVGGIDQYPISAMPEIMDAISHAIQAQRDDREKNSNGRRRRSRG